MKMESRFSFFLCFLYLTDFVLCDDFKCPAKGKVGELKVPNVLSLMDKQTGYYASVEVINPYRNNLVHDYHDLENNVGFVDLEATNQDKVNRRYYYHSTEEKIAVRENQCTRLDLTQNEKIESIKDWFEPTDIVFNSEIFEDFIHLGPTGLMIYANNISDKASYIGSELIEGRSVNHWFYCNNPNGPYIDFYFDLKTSLPYRFSLYYPEWVETEETISNNETKIVEKQVDSESKYVYNFFKFKPLVISSADPIPYPLGYGCTRKGALPSTPLPDFSQVKEFTLDMEAVITYSDRELIKSTARVMKRGDVISYEITEGTDFVRSIEMPPPLGRFEVDEHTGRCQYLTSDYASDVTLITRWPFHKDLGFNLLYYLVMKPSWDHAPTYIGGIPLGPFRVEEYKASNFFSNRIDAIVDYYYPNNGSSLFPSKVIFTKDRSDSYYDYFDAPTQIEVTVINYQTEYFDYEDRFDVSGCYEEPGSYTWFQLLFSNPSVDSTYYMTSFKESVEEYLLSFIPIIRLGEIHIQEVDANIYATVKLHDRVHFIYAYRNAPGYALEDPSNTVKRFKVEDCEQLCSATSNCNDFDYCSDFDCSIYAETFGYVQTEYNAKCIHYSRSSSVDLTQFVQSNYLSTNAHVLQLIRNKVSKGQLRLTSVSLSAEELFIVSGPEEIGDISQELHSSGIFRPLRNEDFPMIKTNLHFHEAQFKTEKGSLRDCFMACLNDDDCNTLSYCINQNKECILSGETSSSLEDKLEDKTSHADGCNIYEKSYMNLFHEYPGKSLVLDAISIKSNVPIGDCAKACDQSKDFNCESFDYCSDNYRRNESVCFLHVNHINIDKAHEINGTNWKFAEDGCSHYSKKSELDYEHKVGFALKENMKDSIVGTFDHLSLEHCASECNSNPDCFTLEFCETIDYEKVAFAGSLTSCSLTNLQPSNVNQPQLFEPSKNPSKICSIYVNHMKAKRKSKVDSSELSSPAKSNIALATGLGALVFILAFAGGFIGFKFSSRRGLIA